MLTEEALLHISRGLEGNVISPQKMKSTLSRIESDPNQKICPDSLQKLIFKKPTIPLEYGEHGRTLFMITLLYEISICVHFDPLIPSIFLLPRNISKAATPPSEIVLENILNILLNFGSELNAKDFKNRSALFYAFRYLSLRTLCYMLRHPCVPKDLWYITSFTLISVKFIYFLK
jgi:hypothetical protein